MYYELALFSYLIDLIFFISYFLSLVDNIFFQALLCSFAISSKILYESVKNVIISSDPKLAVSMLVSRDTKDMSSSDVIKL
ncbi:MAG: cobalamin biosynthesis protein [Arcobacter sp.]|nr:cobalamin biosynthesis protein [Arcobacter sp.]